MAPAGLVPAFLLLALAAAAGPGILASREGALATLSAEPGRGDLPSFVPFVDDALRAHALGPAAFDSFVLPGKA